MKVELVNDFARNNFPSLDMLDYALAVEDVTSSKKHTLILNVDQCIAVCFCDFLRNSGAFSREEAEEYMQSAYMKELEEDTVPDRQRTNLVSFVLLLKALGIDDLIGIDCLDPPPGYMLVWLLDLLYALGAHNDQGELTKDGRRMAKCPMDPMWSKAIVEIEKHQCAEEVCSIVSILHADRAQLNFVQPGGENFALLNVYYLCMITIVLRS
ncbi:hypothetical protein O181_104239 [Austropuccinia psidii MF-1]|uniref:Helicase-associated domain-containing protein n=1 Tax=Austropuccinia psidii MF-1 TaxID=1389203 RepID=A0A9Q3JM18_9BASI|nr:hypothetical protein [Austropuccinia psidii MF-1]